MDTESTKNEAFSHKVSHKVPYDTEKSSTRLAGQKSGQEPSVSNQEWKAGRKEWMIILVIAIVSLMVALDATILVPVLPVRALEKGFKQETEDDIFSGYLERPSW